MSDEIAFRILSSPISQGRDRASAKWDPRNMSSDAQAELRRGVRVDRFIQKHRELQKDPMTIDLVGWDESLARSSPWPWCHRCKSIVRAYGVEDRERPVVVVWARCHGTKQELRIEKPTRDIDSIDEGWLRRQIRHLVFFAA